MGVHRETDWSRTEEVTVFHRRIILDEEVEGYDAYGVIKTNPEEGIQLSQGEC